MPIEIREIIFSSSELTSAVTDFYHRQSLHDDEEILKVTVADDLATPVSIAIYSKVKDERIVETLSKAEVGAALITYCRRNGVMMSRRSRKSVTINGGKIALKLRLVSGKPAEDSPYSSLGT